MSAAPEPCDTCPSGLMFLHSYDGLRRCQRCVMALAETMGKVSWPAKRDE